MRKLFIVIGVLSAFLLIQAGEAHAALPQFPGILSIPVDHDPKWSAYLRQHQPVKIVFGVNHPDGQLKESLTNAALIIRSLKAYKVKYKIQVVLYGNAVKVADPFSQKYGGYSALLEALNQQGVEFRVCYNSLYSAHISPSNVYSFMKVVPAGILQLAEDQMKGYSYISN